MLHRHVAHRLIGSVCCHPFIPERNAQGVLTSLSIAGTNRKDPVGETRQKRDIPVVFLSPLRKVRNQRGIHRNAEHPLGGGDIVSLVADRHIRRCQLLIAALREPGVGDNHILQIKKHHPKGIDQKGMAADNPAILQTFGARDVLVLHIANIHQLVVAYHVNITIFIADYQHVISFVIVNSDNVDVRQTIHFRPRGEFRLTLRQRTLFQQHQTVLRCRIDRVGIDSH